MPVKFYKGQTDEEALKDLELRQLRDNIKREYCKNKGIGLIEISKINEIPEKLSSLIS